MAVAEARAAWQRTVNRCLVQEDAKRAPKLACCPSSHLVKQDGTEHTATADLLDLPTVGLIPYTRYSSYSNFFPKPRWWLQFQHSDRYNLLTVESEMEMSQHNTSCTSCEDVNSLFYESTETESLVDSDFSTPNCLNGDAKLRKLDEKPRDHQNAQDFKKLGDAGYLYELAEMVPASCAFSKKTDELLFDSDAPWEESERTEPWWRILDKDELALLVSQRSFGLVENCDLPQPQKSYSKGEHCADVCIFGRDRIHPPSKDPKHSGGDQAFPLGSKSSMAFVDVSLQAVGTNQLSAVEGTNFKKNVGGNDPGKTELLEALCHSQTRAREAERAAKEAHAEKEHIMKLVFRQASQLFAYKQWLQLLQLENLYHQIKSKPNEPISTLLPVMLPWAPLKAKPEKLQKNWHKGRHKHGKRGRPRGSCLSKYAVAIALGLSLVGAGLLLGWTVGCLLPAF